MPLAEDFATLFVGRTDAIGSGAGRIDRRPVGLPDYARHLAGRGDGIGIFPLLDDGTVHFAAIDLDQPNFEAARLMQQLLPGTSWVERSRSGNAHVWAFFSKPIEAWVPRGIMLDVLGALGFERVEVFPKQDRLLPGMVGNYINLPYHGEERPILSMPGNGDPLTPAYFVEVALLDANDPADWRRRARTLGIVPPEAREVSDVEFGHSPILHECALYIIEGARSGERPIREGHRSAVYFNLAKQLLHWEGMTEDQAWDLVQEVNSLSPDPLPTRELRRIFRNAASGRYTSTGCDDPLMAPYVSPTCPIAGN